MVGRAVTNRAERRSAGSSSLPIFERLAPAAPISELVAHVEAWTRPGEVVLDLNGRGGWVARAAIAGQRRAAELESSSLTRLLADIVLRPPDVRHLDAAAQAISIRPLGDATVRQTIEALFASTCPTCGRPVVLDSLVWEPAGRDRAKGRTGAVTGRADARTEERAIRREFRCAACQRKSGGPDLSHAVPAQADLVAAAYDDLPEETREALRRRFPAPRPDHPLPDQLLGLHTPRQLLGLERHPPGDRV